MTSTRAAGDETRGGTRSTVRWRLVASAEVAVAAAAVLLDLAIPTFVILGVMVVSLLVRRAGLATLGFHRVPRPAVLVVKMLGLAAVWTSVDVALLKPVVSHLSGTTQDLRQFAELQGDVTLLLTWIALGWSVAALGEELAFRGFVQTRMSELVGSRGVRLALAIGRPRS